MTCLTTVIMSLNNGKNFARILKDAEKSLDDERNF